MANKPQDLQQLETEITRLETNKQEFVKNQNFEQAASIRDRIRMLKEKQAQLKMQWLATIKKEPTTIDQKEIEKIVSGIANVPITNLDDGKGYRRYAEIEKSLAVNVIGQLEAVEAVGNAIKKSVVGLRDIKRPISSFIFLGPTGVGKTELAKALARFMFGTEDALIRVDMSEYMEKFNVSRMIGAPPGYIGYENGGELTEKLRRKPYSVVLFDEIEKANPDVFNMLLQILDEGRITDSLGNKIDFRNTVIIFTSNLGTEKLAQKGSLGFNDAQGDVAARKEVVLTELKNTLRPEFLNRIDDIVVFNSLDNAMLEDIFEKMIREMNENLTVQGIKFKVNPAARKHIIELGFESKYGARSIRRAIAKQIEIPASAKMLSGGKALDCEKETLEILVNFKKDKIDFVFKIMTKSADKSQNSSTETKEELVN